MRIAIPYEDGVVCQHFGKAPQFKIFDVQPQGIVESVVIDSEASGHEALAEFLATQGVQAVICGGIGQGALVSLAQSGIDVLPGVSGNPDEVIEALIAGTLQPEGNGGCGCGCGGHHHEEHAGGCGCGGHGHEEHEGGCGLLASDLFVLGVDVGALNSLDYFISSIAFRAACRPE